MATLHCEQPPMLAQLVAAVRGYAQGTETARDIDEQLAMLVEHMRMCFAEEERCMGALGIASRQAHRAQHRLALWHGRNAMQHWLRRRDSETLLRYLEQWLPAWRTEHHGAMDGPCARSMWSAADGGFVSMESRNAS